MSQLLGKKIFFLINPHAGGADSYQWWEQTKPLLDEMGFDYFFEYSIHDQIDDQVKAAVKVGGAQVVVAVGGDGTFSHALNGLIENDALLRDDIVFVAAPLGTSCDFPRLIYPDRLQGLIELLKNGVVKNIDIGRGSFIDEQGRSSQVKYFINSFDAGVGANICVAVNANQGRVKKILKSGKLAFMLTSLKELMRYQYTHIHIELDLETIKGEYIIIGFGNGVYAGGGMTLFPKAKIDDGKLDLLLIPRKGRLEMLRLFSKVYNGTVNKIDGTIYRQLEHIKIKSAVPIYVEMDGEVPGMTDIELDVMPAFLPLLVFEDTLD